MNCEESLAYISSLGARGWRLGLDRMAELVQRARLSSSLGALPGPQFLHVAGTNGKGSTTAYLQSILVESGHTTGAFFSPYVFDPRERWQIGRELVAPEMLALLTTRLRPVSESLAETPFEGATKFEFETLVGLALYAEQRCDWAAIEVGLGGRLDATNVITPRACVIASIGLDHVNVLGDTLEAIAGEKAGIIKPGVPAIAGEMPGEALGVIERRAEAMGSELWRLGREVAFGKVPDGTWTVRTPDTCHSGLRHGMTGTWQAHNMALAVAAIVAGGVETSEEAIRAGVQRAFIPGRFQVLEWKGRTVILDGAHNADAAWGLRRTLLELVPEASGGTLVLLTGMVGGHDPAGFYRALHGLYRAAHVAPIRSIRGLAPEEVAPAVGEKGEPTEVHESAPAAWRRALEDAGEGGIVLVTGSNYLIGDLGEAVPGLAG